MGLNVVLPQHFLLAPIFLYGNRSGYSPQHWVEGPWSISISAPAENEPESTKPPENVSNSKLPVLVESNWVSPSPPLPPRAVIKSAVVGARVVVGSAKSES